MNPAESPIEAVPPLLFAAREAQLAALDRLDRSLWLGTLINSRGSLAPLPLSGSQAEAK